MTLSNVCHFSTVLALILFQITVDFIQGQHSCKVCEQQPSSCRRIAGLYTVTVHTKGTYNPVVEIPAAACSINITELAQSQNYLAVRTANGESIINAFWAIGSTGTLSGAGTRFHYNRGVANCPGECILAEGPTDQRVIVQLLYYAKNPGIAYEFVLPNHIPFTPFDETAPKLETRANVHHRSSHRHHSSRRHPASETSNREPYDENYSLAQNKNVNKDSGENNIHNQGFASVDRDRKVSNAHHNYQDVSYGSHTLGGRGQSYSLQNSDQANFGGSSVDKTYGVHSNSRYVSGVRNNHKPDYISSAGEPLEGSNYDSKTPANYNSRKENAHISSYNANPLPNFKYGQISNTDPSHAVNPGSVYDSYQPRRQPVVQRGVAPTFVRHQPLPSYISSETERGYQALASSSRAGLLDRTYSQTFESDNHLHTFERPAVEHNLRPLLNTGTGFRGDEYTWTISGFTPCSLTCGGGIQETRIICVLTSSGTQVEVTEDNCENALKPRFQRVKCNTEPCQPGWVTEEWSECSVSCGSGTQTRRIECKQRVSDSLELSVSASQCQENQKPAIAQQCETNPCALWQTGPWGQCSSECNGGSRKRLVKCVDSQGIQIPDSYCSVTDRPEDSDSCNTQPCHTQWWHTAWSNQCSANCGSGVATRNVICADRAGHLARSACDESKRPTDKRRCENIGGCGNAWFTGPWSKCSDDCGQGIKSREVLCMKETGGKLGLAIVEDENCQSQEKPLTEEVCFGTACGAKFYMTNWGQCSVTCGTGVRTRAVLCLDEAQRPSRVCDSSKKPPEEELCQSGPCPELQNERQYERSSKTNKTDGGCRDSLDNCRLVVRARLCTFPYYKKVCCSACRHI